MPKDPHLNCLTSADGLTPRPLLTAKPVSVILKVTPATVRGLEIPVVRISDAAQLYHRYRSEDVELYIRDDIDHGVVLNGTLTPSA